MCSKSKEKDIALPTLIKSSKPTMPLILKSEVVEILETHLPGKNWQTMRLRMPRDRTEWTIRCNPKHLNRYLYYTWAVRYSSDPHTIKIRAQCGATEIAHTITVVDKDFHLEEEFNLAFENLKTQIRSQIRGLTYLL